MPFFESRGASYAVRQEPPVTATQREALSAGSDSRRGLTRLGREGDFFGLLGPNGAADLHDQDDRRVQDVSDGSPGDRLDVARTTAGTRATWASSSVLPRRGLSVRRNLEVYAATSRPPSVARHRIDEGCADALEEKIDDPSSRFRG